MEYSSLGRINSVLLIGHNILIYIVGLIKGSNQCFPDPYELLNEGRTNEEHNENRTN